MNTRSHYDVVIIGAGMSGLAAGIRLAHFGKSVCIFERHNAVGGLNSFYSIGGRKFDVGLHALTNFARPGVKGTPLTKLLRQLRIEREEFALCEQKQSRVAFGKRGEVSLRFTNDFAILESEIARQFPTEIDGFRNLLAAIKTYDDVSLEAVPESARAIVRRYIKNPLLEDMLFCPVMYYGSSQEHDMEFGQFVIMFKALFLEGFARPFEGVRVILRVLLEKYRAAGGERRMKCGVQKIQVQDTRVSYLTLDTGEEITAEYVISSIGAPETQALIAPQTAERAHPVGQLSFVETISILDRQPAEIGCDVDTIVFFNDSDRFTYERPDAPVDPRSGVICIPNNFDFGPERKLPEGILRVTCLANYNSWASWSDEKYAEEKQRWFAEVQSSALRFLTPISQNLLSNATIATDMFTPRTIEKYTGHFAGAIYGAPEKVRSGRTAFENLFLCGTDQGFLGIVGAMLSGISISNYQILTKK